MIKEVWKDILGYEGLYKINNFGMVKSIPRLVPFGNQIRMTKECILQPKYERYYSVQLFKCKRQGKMHRIHRLLAEAFIPNPNNYKYVNHINAIKTDNRIENLEWCTQKHNAIHAQKLGLNKGSTGRTGELSNRSKLIINLETGIYYYGCMEASLSSNFSKNRIFSMLNGLLENKSKFIYA